MSFNGITINDSLQIDGNQNKVNREERFTSIP